MSEFLDALLFIPLVIIGAVASVYLFGFSGMFGEKVAKILKIKKDSFPEWIILMIFFIAALLILHM